MLCGPVSGKKIRVHIKVDTLPGLKPHSAGLTGQALFVYPESQGGLCRFFFRSRHQLCMQEYRMISFIDMLQKGGVLVWPILACSLVGTTVFFERLLTFRATRDRNGTAEKILALLARDEPAEARAMLGGRAGKKRRSSPENILREALSVQGRDRKSLETVLSHAVSRELDILSRHLGILATAGNIAPLLGLLGTVFGMIKAFIQVESLGGRVNAAALAGGIWEAMLTTAFGLVVAIPLMIFHGYLEARLGVIQTDLEDVAVAVLKNWRTENE